MIDFLVDFLIDIVIAITVLMWAVSLFWVLLYLTEKILRKMYQDSAQYPPPIQELEPRECCDCGMIMMLDADGRCDLCVSIFNAELDQYGFSRADRALHREIRNELRF